MKRGKLSIVALVWLILAMSITFSYSSPEINMETVKVIPMQNQTPLQIQEAAGSANDMGIPVVFYTPQPELLERRIIKYQCKANLNTGKVARELIHNKTKTEFLRKYTIAEPGNIYKQVSYTSDIDTSSWFDTKLAEEIDRLEEAYSEIDLRMDHASYDGDSPAIAQHWQWERTSVVLVSSLDDNNNGWTYESTYAWDLWASVPDVDLDLRYWMFEWIVTTYVDDYKFEAYDRFGPWVSERYIKNDGPTYGPDEQLWKHQPTASTSEFSYSISTGITATTGGPEIFFGSSATWTGQDVTMEDSSLKSQDYTKWIETFRGVNYQTLPWPSAPCVASYHTYESYRSAQWQQDSDDDTGEWVQDTQTTITWHENPSYHIFYWTYIEYHTYNSNTDWTWKKITN